MIYKNKFKIYDDIFYLWHSKYLTILPNRRREYISPDELHKKIITIIKILVKDTLLLFEKNSTIKDGRVVVFVSTKNNHDSVKFLDEYGDFCFIQPITQKRNYNAVLHHINYRLKIFYDIILPLFLFRYLNNSSNKYSKRFWDYCFRGAGLYEESVRWLKKNKPKAIIFSNDHSVEQRAMLNAANKLGVPTIYIQHATVSEYFPPLKFDLSLLEGRDALNKYKSISDITGDVKLIGMPKSDEYVANRNFDEHINRIGICYGPNETLDEVEKLVFTLSENLQQLIYLRPHPADNRKLKNKFSENVKFSNSKTEEAFEFLSKMDCIIAGNSSIHLEAVILNVLSLYFNFNKIGEMFDYYGFIENNMSIEVKTAMDIINIIHKYESDRPTIYMRSKYYNAAIGTPIEGRVKEHTINTIYKFLSN